MKYERDKRWRHYRSRLGLPGVQNIGITVWSATLSAFVYLFLFFSILLTMWINFLFRHSVFEFWRSNANEDSCLFIFSSSSSTHCIAQKLFLLSDLQNCYDELLHIFLFRLTIILLETSAYWWIQLNCVV